MLCCQLQLEFAPYFHRGAECCTVLLIILWWRYFNAHQGVISKAFLTTTVRGICKGRGFTARGRGGNRFRVSFSSSSETVIFTCLLFSSWSWCKFFFSFCGLLPSLLKLMNPTSELTIMGPELRISSGYRPVFALPPRLSWQTPTPTPTPTTNKKKKPTTTTTTRDIRNSQRISWNSRKSKGITGILERPNSPWNSH